MLSDPDQERAGRAMEAMLKMSKIDVAALRQAFEGGSAVDTPRRGAPST